MRSVNRYALANAKGVKGRSILERYSKALDVEVEGSVLEKQYELEGGCVLIWLTDDSPYDEGLHVYLVDQSDSILDAVEAGADFTSGILKIVDTGTDWVEFEFFSNDSVYRLQVTEEAGFRMLLPMGWKYKKAFSLHRLVVRETQKGEH